MIRLNLLPDIKREYLRTRRLEARVISLAILVSIISAGLVVVVALWVYGAQTIHKAALTADIKKNHETLKQEKDIEKYVTVQNQLANISSLHEKKAILSRVFDIVPKLNPKTPNNVTIASLDVDAALTQMQFEGETASFTGLETFRDTLVNAKLVYQDAANNNTAVKEALFSDVQIVSQGLTTAKENGGSVVSFKVMATYNTKTFARNIGTLTIEVPNLDTTQSKQDTPSVFGESTAEEEQ